MKRYLPLIALLLALMALINKGHADPQTSEIEAKLRDTLRNTMLQLRDAQNQSAGLQAQLDQANAAAKDLQTKLDLANATIKKQADDAASAQTTSEKTIAGLNDSVTSLTKQLADYGAAIGQWKIYQSQAEKMMALMKTANQQLTLQTVELQRLVADRQTKNFELYQIGNEILTRYEKFSFGDALAAKEPFLGLERTKLETLVQGYKDALDKSKTSPATGLVMKTPP